MPFPRPAQSLANPPAATGTYISYARLVSLYNEMRLVYRQSTASLHDSLNQSEQIQALRTGTLALHCNEAYDTLQAIENALQRSEENIDCRIRHMLETTQTVAEIRAMLLIVWLCWEWLLRIWVEGGWEV